MTRIDSIPSGAEVFVMGERLGTTPLDVEDRLIFPVVYAPEQASLYGRVTLRHEGCETVVRPIDLEASSGGLLVELPCADEPPRTERPSTP